LRISTALWALLSSTTAADAEVAEIVRDPVLAQEAEVLLPSLEHVAKPSGDVAVRAEMQRLVLVFGAPEAAKTTAFWDAYYGQLRGLPAEAVSKAVDDCMGACKFFPKPAELREFAAKHAEPVLRAVHRVRRVVQAKAGPPPVGSPERPRAERKAFEGLMADFRDRMARASGEAEAGYPKRMVRR